MSTTPLGLKQTRAARELTVAFAIMGLVGAWLVSIAMREASSPRSLLTPAMTIALLCLTSFTAAGLGLVLASDATGPAHRIPFRVAAGTLFAGAANGLMVGLFAGISGFLSAFGGMIAGVAVGGLMSVPFFPTILWLVFTTRRIGRARERSVLDRSDRRAVWRILAISTSVAVALIQTKFLGFGGVVGSLGAGVCAVALTVIVVLALLDVRAWWRVRALAKADPSLPLLEATDSANGDAVDLGVGNDTRGNRLPGAYRRAERAVTLWIGDPEIVRGHLARSLVASALGVAVAVSSLVVVRVSTRSNCIPVTYSGHRVSP
jgi:hypothetical protein